MMLAERLATISGDSYFNEQGKWQVGWRGREGNVV
jgi:hypothetical protein